jgi:hypothetical protein
MATMISVHISSYLHLRSTTNRSTMVPTAVLMSIINSGFLPCNK